jgi:hypothetical protein
MEEEETPEQTDEIVDKADLSEFSFSVRTAVRGLEDKQISSWTIVQRLAELHPEYGDGLAKILSKERGPAQVVVKPVYGWLAEVRHAISADRRYVLDGRLTILALAKIDHALGDYLSENRFLDALKKELKEPYENFFPSDSGTQRLLPDPTPLQMDTPALVDQLGRKAFGRTLAVRLGRIWNENRAANADTSFMLHLHGPWGAGKTSLLNLLRNEFQPHPRPAIASSRWVVVDFNAWQNQRLNPPWWPFLDNVYRQALDQLSTYYQERRRGWALRLRELWWRFITVNREHVLFGFIALLLAAVLSVMAWHYWPRFVTMLTPTETQMAGKPSGALDLSGKAISGLLAIGGAIIALSSFASRSFLSGSARAAQTFVQSAVDPMARIAEHFRKLITWVAHPIIIFIDDLDRCPSEYVVNLLEGIQTLFKDCRVLYVISADRRWLYTCYEKVYEPFAASIREPGRTLGCLFLEKAVQLSVSLPRLTPELQTVFWDYLARGESGNANQRLEQAAEQARSEFEGAVTQDAIASKLRSGSGGDDPIQAHVRREEAVLRLATERIEESTAYFLKEFAPLLEPNPRAMKRLLNAYALHRDMAILGGIDVLDDLQKRKRLVLWTIVCLRWPLLEEILSENVDYADVIHGLQPPETLPKTMRRLLTRESVKEVFGGGNLGVQLDKTAIIEFAGLRTSKSGAATVS